MRKIILKIIYKLKIFELLFYVLRIFKVDENKILFECSAGRGYGDSPREISDMLDSKKKYKIVWVCNKNKQIFPKEIKTVNRSSLRYIYEHVTSKVWVSNVRKPGFVKKRKNQFYLQTWHSPLRLKKIEKDAIKYLTKQVIENSINDAKNTDLMISGCSFSSTIYKNSFWYSGNVVEIGTPRCDMFFDDSRINNIKKDFLKKYNIEESKKIILYAPTYRNNEHVKFNFPDFQKMLKEINDIVILIRFHPSSKMKIEADSSIIDVTKYSNMQELLAVSDLLITDYSSSMFDMMIAKKKCLLYVPDLQEYIKQDRDFYFEINELPFFKSKNSDELINLIKNFDENLYMSKINEFKKIIGLKESGTATKAVVEIIEGVLKNEKI